MRRQTGIRILIGSALITFPSLVLVINSEIEALFAWLIAIALLLPPLLWALKTPYVALKTICLLAFITQIITLPFFYIARDEVTLPKNFSFTAEEAWRILSSVMIFLFCLIGFFKLFYRLRLFHGLAKPESDRFQLHIPQATLRQYPSKHVNSTVSGRKRHIYSLLVVVVIVVVSPLNLWMYSQGIGLAGVSPPKLPFKLAGILHYFTAYFVPILLGFLYLNSKRGFLLSMVLICYALLSGLTSLSRKNFLLLSLPIIGLAWIERRRLLLVVAGLISIAGYSVVTFARGFVYTVLGGISMADTSNTILSVVVNILTYQDKLFDVDTLLQTFYHVFNRIEGFENLVRSKSYDLYAVCKPIDLILRLIWRDLAPIDVDLHHLQWQGFVLIEGFNNGGALLSNVVILANANLLWIIASALLVAGILVALEKSTYRMISLYRLPDWIAFILIGYMSIVFFIEAGGSVVFVAPFLFILVASWLPPIYRFEKLRHLQQHCNQASICQRKR
jgi:hypothetical protein